MTNINELSHGGNVEEAARKLGLSTKQIIDFSANINPQGLPPGLKKYLRDSVDVIAHYPEIYASDLIDKLSGDAGLPSWSFLAAAGSTPLIYMLARHLGTAKHAIVAPAFSEYEAALKIAGLRNITYRILDESTLFVLTPEKVEDILKDAPDMVILANPANPTGRLVPNESLEILLKASTEKGFWLVVDEAFMGFCQEDRSLLAATKDNPSLIVLRSLTKIFAIPGLRLGYLVCGNQFFMKNLADTMEPWAINALAQKAGIFLLDKRDYLKKTPEITWGLRGYATKNLAPYFDFIPSDCNFLMGCLKYTKRYFTKGSRSGYPPPPAGTRRNDFIAPAEALKEKQKLLNFLFKQGLLVRDLDNMKGLAGGYLRLAVRPVDDVNRLVTALEVFYDV
ncbi:MAG: aminotransferase class I/II-fold pyridoxal phosphate-dependent enzyme [Deltaproteobacteria bacterium]|jgi:threonine-phosphate decarboxylase|nr:aminotransferase class I/II-fold pyridoxal phosphate-dependent enzyme [Deltaproteobacteria bacterium]